MGYSEENIFAICTASAMSHVLVQSLRVAKESRMDTLGNMLLYQLTSLASVAHSERNSVVVWLEAIIEQTPTPKKKRGRGLSWANGCVESPIVLTPLKRRQPHMENTLLDVVDVSMKRSRVVV